MPNLVSLTCPGLQKLDKTQRRVFPIFGFLVKFFMNKNFHNSTSTNDIDMKIKIVNKPDLRNMKMSKKISYKFLLANCNVVILLIIS